MEYTARIGFIVQAISASVVSPLDGFSTSSPNRMRYFLRIMSQSTTFCIFGMLLNEVWLIVGLDWSNEKLIPSLAARGNGSILVFWNKIGRGHVKFI